MIDLLYSLYALGLSLSALVFLAFNFSEPYYAIILL